MKWLWSRTHTDVEHVAASERTIDRLDRIAERLEGLQAELRDTVNELREENVDRP